MFGQTGAVRARPLPATSLLEGRSRFLLDALLERYGVIIFRKSNFFEEKGKREICQWERQHWILFRLFILCYVDTFLKICQECKRQVFCRVIGE